MVHGAPGELNLASLGQLAKTLDHVIEPVSCQLFGEDGVYVEGDFGTRRLPQHAHQRPIALLGDLAEYLLGLGGWLIDVKEVAPVHSSFLRCCYCTNRRSSSLSLISLAAIVR